MDWINFLEEKTETMIINLGISADWAIYFRLLSFIIVLTFLSVVAYYITKKIIIRFLYKVFKKTSFAWDDLFVDTRAFDNLAHIAPAIIVLIMALSGQRW
jgi:miniconductance mechanosensitive channel